MAKIVKLLLILICISVSLNANDYTKELQSYDKKIVTSSDDELLRIHHALKSIYIHSIVQNDSELKRKALEKLVKTSKLLKLNSDGYSKELETINKTLKPLQKTPKVKEKKVAKKDNIKNVKIKKKKLSTVAKLEGISDKGDRLELHFNRKMNSNDVKSFQLKGKKSYREVFDIKAILPFVPKVKTPRKLKDLRMAQHSDDKLRIVFQRESILKSTMKIRGDKIDIYYNGKNETKVNSKVEKNYVKLLAKNKVIVIDAGHGGKDGGAVGSKTELEKHLVLKLALKIGKNLQKRGYKVFYTRTSDKFIKLRNRTKYANSKNADLFLSIHANAARKKSLHGVETFFLSPARSTRSKNVAALENKSDMQEMDYFSKQTFLNVFNREKIIAANKLALDVQQGMLNRLKSKYSNIRDGGVREAPFWVLVGAQMPAILIESGYISNKAERKRMFTSQYQDLISRGVADGIDSYFMKNEY